MRVARLLLIFMCVFLFAGDKYAHASTRYPLRAAIKAQYARHGEKTEHASRKSVSASASFQEDNPMISIENDDDDNTSSIRKYLLQDKYIFLLALTFIFGPLISRLKTHLPFCAYLSCTGSGKYLLQRSLRI